MPQRIGCGDAGLWIGVQQPRHEVLQGRRVRLRELEAGVSERDPRALGLALGEGNELVADGATSAAQAAALADGAVAPESLLTACEDVSEQGGGKGGGGTQ